MPRRNGWLALRRVAPGASAQEPLRLFDAHLHYNQEAMSLYPLDKALEIFRRNGVTGILATSRPNLGTNQLFEAKPPGLWVVPFLRPYRVRSDVQTWSTDPAIFELIQTEYKRGYYRGIGEFHIYGQGAAAELVKKTVEFAGARDLFLHAHCDEQALRHPVRAQSARQDHLGAYRLHHAGRARARSSWTSIPA